MTQSTPLALSTIEDILVASKDGSLRHIPVDVYKNAPKIEWVEIKDEQQQGHICFTTNNGYRPFNLYGPAVTKVLPWNIQSAKLPKSCQNIELGPGYWIDLRKLRVETNRFAQSLEHSPIASPDGQLSPCDAWLPQDALSQLKLTPEDNLYIVSWSQQHNSSGDYQINYLSAEQLAKCQLLEQPAHEKEKTLVEQYFIDAGVQTGVLYPQVNSSKSHVHSDVTGEGGDNFDIANFFVLCCVVNLASFD